jgi:hypothetical protein
MCCESLSREYLLVVTLSCFSLLDPYSRSGRHSQLTTQGLTTQGLMTQGLLSLFIKIENVIRSASDRYVSLYSGSGIGSPAIPGGL